MESGQWIYYSPNDSSSPSMQLAAVGLKRALDLGANWRFGWLVEWVDWSVE